LATGGTSSAVILQVVPMTLLRREVRLVGGVNSFVSTCSR
jgi:hypothetical protein